MASNRNSSNPKMRFISRGPRYWRVWVNFGDFTSGQLYFNDSAYGGQRNALTAAKYHRDRIVLLNDIPIRKYEGNGFCVKHMKNTSGTVGITLVKDKSRVPFAVNWSTRSMVNGVQVQASRSVRLPGYVKAWRMVAAIRAKYTGMEIPNQPPPPPAWLKRWAKSLDISLEDPEALVPPTASKKKKPLK